MYRLVVGIATLNTVFANLVNNSTAASGKNFLLVGDFAYILNMTPAYETFDAMNKLANQCSVIVNKSRRLVLSRLR